MDGLRTDADKTPVLLWQTAIVFRFADWFSLD